MKIKIGDHVKIIERYCADDAYVGLSGKIIRFYSSNMLGKVDPFHTAELIVDLPKQHPKYWLGSKICFPVSCLEVCCKEVEKKK